MQPEPITRASWAASAARLAQHRGLDARALVESAGLDYAALDDPAQWVPVSAMRRLWDALVELTGDPSVALECARFTQPASFHSLGFALLASETFEDTLRRRERFSGLITNAGYSELELRDDIAIARYRVPPGSPMPALSAFEAMMACDVALERAATCDPGFAPREVQVMRPPGPYAERFAQEFGCKVRFGCRAHARVYDRQQLAMRLPMADAEMARMHDRISEASLQGLADNSVSARVRHALVRILEREETPSREGVARCLHLSDRALHRALDKEGTSFKVLLGEVRMARAEHYLQHSSRSLTEIALRLGFSEPSNFTRAFRRWSGCSPSAYRARHAAPVGDTAARPPV